MTRTLYLLYGVIAYLLFLGAILYAICFLANIEIEGLVRRTVDGPTTKGGVGEAIAMDLLLLAAFALQHNLMARPWFKERWTRIVPRPIERSTFVAASSLLLFLLYWQWRPIPERIWHVESTAGVVAIWAAYAIGWLLVLYSTFVIDHFELFGLKQVWRYFRGQELASAPFSERSVYRWVRHPLMLGFLIAFWATPTMTLGRALFAIVTTLWIVFSIFMEERDLVRILGEPYRDYRRRTPMLLPVPRAGTRGGETE